MRSLCLRRSVCDTVSDSERYGLVAWMQNEIDGQKAAQIQQQLAASPYWITTPEQ